MKNYISLGKNLLLTGSKSRAILASANRSLVLSNTRCLSLCQLPVNSSTTIATKQFTSPVSAQQLRNIFTTNNFQSTLQFKLADIGEGIAEVSIKEWYVKVGDVVKQFDKICEVQSDKATVTITSRYDGTITKIYYNVDDTAFVGKPLVDIDVGEAGAPSSSSSPKQTDTISDSLERTESAPAAVSAKPEFKIVSKVLATPAVRKMAMDYKVNIADVQGSGKDGRILKEDVLKFVDGSASASRTKSDIPAQFQQPAQQQQQIQNQSRPQAHVSHPPPRPPIPSIAHLAADRKEAIKGIKKAMAKSMSASNHIPHFSYCDEYNMNVLVEYRSHFKHLAKERGIAMSYLPFFIKACSMSLHANPILNAYVDEKCENLTYKAHHNIGIAMDTPDGLLVPNIKNCETKSIFEIASELNRLQSLASTSKLTPGDLNGGTFTLSNIGSIGGTYMKPVILPPEVAIGALGKIQKLPRFDHENKVIPVNIMQISWSADHRVIDGATMARFSNLVKKYIENLNLLLIDLK